MEEKAPTLEQWRRLYEGAEKFKQIRCWQYMYDSDIFGIQNPWNGEIGYVCVIGNLGQLLGLVLNLGAEGLSGYKKMQSGKLQGRSPEEVYQHQKCLMATFGEREGARAGGP